MGSPNLSEPSRAFLDIDSREALAEWLNLNDRKLRYLLYKLSPADRYKTFYVKKRNGGDRRIDAPSEYLKRLQRRINRAIQEIAPAREIAKGFVRDRSILDHARLHRGRNWVIVADLADFFPTINFGRVLGAFRARPFQFPDAVATCLAQLCCYEGALPQGAPTSPAISNLICRSLDRDLATLAKKSRVSVSRYADDICFSTNNCRLPAEIVAVADDGTFVAATTIDSIVRHNGFLLNPRKFKVRSSHQRQMVTGLIVNHGVALPRSWKRQLRVMLNIHRKYGSEGGGEIVSRWKRMGARTREVSSLEKVINGKANFANWIDAKAGTHFVESLHRGYPHAKELIPRIHNGITFRIMAEGDTDLMHLQTALKQFNRDGRFEELAPRFENYKSEQGDADLWATLQRLASVNVYEYVVGIFDCDNKAFMHKCAASPGEFIRLGQRVFALFLAPPRPGLDEFCIESLYDRSEATRFTPDGRRLFFGDEFDAKTGIDTGSEYRRQWSGKKSVVVSDKVLRLSDGKSSLLSKMEFAKMVSVGAMPFSEIKFDGFVSTFHAIRGIFDSV